MPELILLTSEDEPTEEGISLPSYFRTLDIAAEVSRWILYAMVAYAIVGTIYIFTT